MVSQLQQLLAQGQLELADELAEPLRALPSPSERLCQLLGELQFGLHDLPGSAHWFERSLHSPEHRCEGLMGLGRALRGMNRLAEAQQCFDQACQLQPHNAWARLGRAELRLAQNLNDPAGWDDYEARFQVDGLDVQTVARTVLQEFAPTLVWNQQPLWQGQRLPQGTLLIWKEQGDGDFFQFARFIPLLRSRVARVMLACRCSLRRLAASIPGVDLVVEPLGSGFPSLHFDAHIPLLSLARLAPAGLPPPPYLHALPREVKTWRRRWARLRGPKVGLVWAGQRLSNPEPRSLALQALAPLAEVPGIHFFSLQVGPDAVQANWPPHGMELRDLQPQLFDWANTAAALMSLDLLICIDSGIAHLAGALGVPTWLLLHHDAGWRWQRHSSRSAWYPSLKLYRQERPGCWQAPIAAVARDLASLG